VVLFAGGHGGLQIADNGQWKWGGGNFLVRSRQLFAEHDLLVAVVDAPSDRQTPPHLSGFRQTREHVADIKAVMAWLREHVKVPVWLIGTSRGTQSAAFLATQLRGPDGPTESCSPRRSSGTTGDARSPTWKSAGSRFPCSSFTTSRTAVVCAFSATCHA